MGYRSDIRAVCSEERFKKLAKEEKKKFKKKDYRIFTSLSIEEHNNGYVLFGWDNIKWYANFGDSDYEQETWFDDLFHDEKEGFNFVRLGEEMDDIEEVINDYDMPYPVIIHGFDDSSFGVIK